MLVTPTKTETEWGRPRRGTDPHVVRRSSELLRQAARRSMDCSSPASDQQQQRPQTSTTTTSSTTTKGSSTPQSHRSSLSIHALSNPAFAEIPSRKFNTLRLSTGSSDNSLCSPTNVSENVQSVPCTRDMPAAAASTDIIVPPDAATSTSPKSPRSQLISFQSYTSQTTLEHRSPSLRRAPASRSSLGIETATGPPPALSTQQHSSFQDRHLQSYSKQSTPTTPKTIETYPSPRIDAVVKNESRSGDSASERRRRQSAPLSPQSAAKGLKSIMSSTTTYTRENAPNGLHDSDRTMSSVNESNGEETRDHSTDGSRSKNDDIFLNIAKSSASRRDSLSKLDRRRRLGLSGLSARSSLAKEQTPSPEQLKSQNSPFLSQDGSPLVPYSSAYQSPASAHPLDESSRLRYFGVGSSARSTVGLPRSRFSRETSPEASQTYPDFRSTMNENRSFRNSNQSNLSSSTRTIRQPSASDAAERARIEAEKSRTDGTESTLSTTAPSTVWDELDDLKSRIRKLELTGKFPPSSAAAMSNASGERPRTAATTVTTLSTSPKHNRKTSASPDSESSANNQIQKLLNSALAKAKVAVSTEVYRALEVTTTDALTLTNMLSSTALPSGAASVVANGFSMSERQAKRKADSLCRSLTELYLALSEDQTISLPPSQQQRPVSRDTGSRVNPMNGTDSGDAMSTATAYRRSTSFEPESAHQPESTPSVSSRLEARRASAINISSARTTRLSQDETLSPQAPHSAPISRLSRLSTYLRTKREEDSDEKGSVFSRTGPSRAMTETGNFSSGSQAFARERLSREYVAEPPSSRLPTSQQAQPQQIRAPPSVQSAIPLRRSYASPAGSGIPATTGINIQPGFRRYGQSGLTHSISERILSDSPGETQLPQPLSATRIVAPSGKTATSYTSIQQPRARTNSLTSRRLVLRPRPSNVGNVDDNH